MSAPQGLRETKAQYRARLDKKKYIVRDILPMTDAEAAHLVAVLERNLAEDMAAEVRSLQTWARDIVAAAMPVFNIATPPPPPATPPKRPRRKKAR